MPNETTWDWSSWEDTDLTKEWNRIDQAKHSNYLEAKADAIEVECAKRRIIAWDGEGNVTERDAR